MSSGILEILDEIAADTKRGHKLSVITKSKDNPLFRRVLSLALDPYVQFYIRKIPEYTATSANSLSWALDELTKLSSRQLTGHAGIAHLADILTALNPEDAVVITRIIGKDLRCGASDATVNAVIENFIPTYPCLLARPYEEKNLKNITYPALSQLKADGVRANVRVDNGVVTICGRSGKEIDLKGCLDNTFITLADKYGTSIVFDGELIVVDEYNKIVPRKMGNGIINKAIRGTISDAEAKAVRVQLWDAIPLSEFKAGKSTQEYISRFEKLVNTVDALMPQGADKTAAILNGTYTNCWVIPNRIVNDLQEAVSHFEELLSQGEEGTILKNFCGLWEDSRSKHLVKLKAELTCELEITGYNPGIGKFHGLVGSLICSSSDRLVECAISGISDELRLEITNNIDQLIGKIVTVKYNERISSKSSGREGVDSLFLPRFECFRDDKHIADSSNEIPTKQ